jgi:hypothetical protein
LWIPALAVLLSASALAQTPPRISGNAFARDPARYLNQRIRVDDFACWSNDGAYRCESGKELDVLPHDVGPAAAKQKITEECGGLDGVERTPGCVFDLVFTPTSLAKGDGNITRNGVSSTGQIWIVQTDSVTAVPRR